MTASDIEKIKLRASFLNSIAASSVVAALITPAIGLSLGVIQTAVVNLTWAIGAAVFWFVIAVMLHSVALRVLDQLE